MMDDSYRIYRMINCKNCERAACRLMASRDEPGPAPGEMQRCPECGDRRWVVPITVASWLEGEDSDGRTLGWTEAQPTTTFTVPAGVFTPWCNCGRRPEWLSDGRDFSIYECKHVGPVPEPVWSDPDHVSVLRGAPAPVCHCGRVAVYDRLSGYASAPSREHYTCDHGASK
jgi:hypothetical protein